MQVWVLQLLFKKIKYWAFEPWHLDNYGSPSVTTKYINVHLHKVDYLYCIKHLKYWHFKFHFSISTSLVFASVPSVYDAVVWNNTRLWTLAVSSRSRPEMLVMWNLFLDIDNSRNLYPCMWEFRCLKKVIISCDVVNWKNLSNVRYGVNTVRFSKNFSLSFTKQETSGRGTSHAPLQIL